MDVEKRRKGEKEKTKEGHENIEKLPMECKKDMLNFSEYFDEYSDSRPGKRHFFFTQPRLEPQYNFWREKKA